MALAETETQHRFRSFAENMRRVLAAHRKARKKLSAKAVHQLRVALRASNSVAKSARELDSHPAWEEMHVVARKLFKALGNLRDVQVIAKLVKKLSAVGDSVSRKLRKKLSRRGAKRRKRAKKAIEKFDRKAWRRLQKLLPERTERVPLEDPAWEQLALARWGDAETQHFKALEKRTRDSYHELRIALKRFRYTITSFLPGRALLWGKDLRRLQNVLGQVHDLDLLDGMVKSARYLKGGQKKRWRAHIEKEIQQRVDRYRKLTMGEQSLYSLWRAGLPGDARLHESAVALLAARAMFLDSDFAHSAHVTRLALQLFDALRAAKLRDPFHEDKPRFELEAASFLHHICGEGKGAHKLAARAVRAMQAPIGWSSYEMDYIADLVRYQRGSESLSHHRRFANRPQDQQRAIARLAGVLRLAIALDSSRDGAVKGLSIEARPEAIIVRAEGLDEHGPAAQSAQHAKPLLEQALDRLVLVKSADYAQAAVRADISEEE